MLLVVAVLPAAIPAWAGPAHQVPPHLQPALAELGRARMPVLVPPERPSGTTATVSEGTRGSYRLLFTNDPDGSLSHVEQINVFVRGSVGMTEPPEDARPFRVRGTDGAFFCGAAACFLDWTEDGASYSIGEFGSPVDAAGFAESLVLLEELLDRAVGESATPPRPDRGLPSWVVALLVGGGLLVAAGAALAARARR